MSSRARQTVLASLCVLASLLSLAVVNVPASANAGTFTQITTPSGDLHFAYDPTTPANNHFQVSGTTSLDVTSVDIDCFYTENGSLTNYNLAKAVPVVFGSFSAIANYGAWWLPVNTCRLRAIPSTVKSFTWYLGAFAGPVLYSSTFVPQTNGSTEQEGYSAFAAASDAIVSMTDAANCGVKQIQPTRDQVIPQGQAIGCTATLHVSSLAAPAPTRSAVRVDGRDAYLPHSVSTYSGFVNVKQPPLTMSYRSSPTGEMTISESSPLWRCLPGGAYPPNATNCASLVSTGVVLSRTLSAIRGGLQVQIRDRYLSADGGPHALDVEYQNALGKADSGSPGIRFPGEAGFAVPTKGQVRPGFASGSATIYTTADVYANPSDSNVGSGAVTWSRPPSSAVIDATYGDAYGLRYALSVPAGGSDEMGFTVSGSTSLAQTQALASAAEAEMMSAPSISSPANGARVGSQTTTVTGAVSAGTNGLPTAVLVNGHPATITPTSAATATYSVRFAQSWGTHPVTVVAVDAGGNARSASVTVTNSPALGVRARPRLSRASLVVPLSCQRFAASSCVGKVVVKSARGAVIGSSRAFTVGRGRSANIGVRIRPGNHTVRVYLYQREPSGRYVLAAAKPCRI